MNKAVMWVLAASALLVFQGKAVAAQVADVSKIEYLSSCGACHGTDGKGNGPTADQLKVAPPDLTQLAKKNGGIFPLNNVYEKIEGRQEIKAHGSREMPIWGYRYWPWPNKQINQTIITNPPERFDFFFDPSYDPEAIRRTRILSVVDYLYRIQEK